MFWFALKPQGGRDEQKTPHPALSLGHTHPSERARNFLVPLRDGSKLPDARLNPSTLDLCRFAPGGKCLC